MPRKKQPPRLYLRKREGREAIWCIRDGDSEYSTGCGEADTSGAAEALKVYLEKTYRPPRENSADKVLIANVISFYMKERVPDLKQQELALNGCAHLLEWWGSKKVADIRPAACRAYAAWRISAGERRLSSSTARRDLAVLSSALNFYHSEFCLDAVPAVKLPQAAPRREAWLSRSQAAALLWAAWRNKESRHLVRYILCALYSGTRSAALLGLRWMPSASSGWIDLDAQRLYRRGQGQRELTKRAPPAPLHSRLLPHVARWQRMDAKGGITHVIHCKGKPIEKLRRSWRTACKAAGLGPEYVPHSLRHTCVTWLLQSGVDRWEVAGFTGMTVEVIERFYGHHSLDFQANAAKAIAPRLCPGNDARDREQTAIPRKAIA